LKNKELPCLSIYNNSIIDFVQKYNLKRHEEFDSIVNKNFSLRYLIEWQTHLKDSLPNQILFNNENISLNWMLFPQAVKLLSNGKEKNFLQLAHKELLAINHPLLVNNNLIYFCWSLRHFCQRNSIRVEIN
jgi:hypothetical protein